MIEKLESTLKITPTNTKPINNVCNNKLIKQQKIRRHLEGADVA